MSFNPLNLLLAPLAPVLIACAMYQTRLKWIRGARFLTAALIASAFWALMDVMCLFDEFQNLWMEYTNFSILGWVAIPLYALFTLEQAGLPKKRMALAAAMLLVPSAFMYICALLPGLSAPLFTTVTRHTSALGAGLYVIVTPLGAACLAYHALLALSAAAVTFTHAARHDNLTILCIAICALLVATALGLAFMALGRASTITATLPMALAGVLSLLMHPSLYADADNDGLSGAGLLLSQAIARRKAANSDPASERDPLTGLASRELFTDLLQQELYRNERTRKHIGVMRIHIDNLDEAIGALDSRAGDMLIYELAQRIKRHMRKTDIIAALDRDEFIIALPQIQDPRSIMTGLITRLFDAMQSPYHIAERRVTLSFSIGTTIAPDDGNTVDVLLLNSSTALAYAAADKQTSYRYYSEAMNTLTNERMHDSDKLRRAMENRSFFVLYQPQLDVGGHERKLCGLEALLYWRDDTLGERPAEPYMSVAEEFGLIHGIGQQYFHETLRTFGRLSEAVGRDIRLSLSIMLKQLYEPGFAAEVMGIAAEYGIAPQRLTYNIPEAAVLSPNRSLGGNVAALRAAGAHICLDNFGTGQSSLLNMREFSIDALRLDKGITQPVLEDAKSAAMVHTLAVMSGGIDVQMSVSGVQNSEQMRKLITLGCTRMQGDWFAPPMTAEALKEWLAG